jgi:hypothetical protein
MRTRRNNSSSVVHRMDADNAYFLNEQLVHLDPTTFYELFAGHIGRRFIPLIEGIGKYAEVYKYQMVTMHGTAKKARGKTNDAPTVRVTKKQVTQSIKKIAVEYGWSVDEIGAARSQGSDLDTQTLQAAIGSVEQEIDDMLAFGDADAPDITGLLNNSNIADTTPVTKTGGGTLWTGASVKASEIIKDVTNMVAEARKALKQANEVGTGMPAFPKFSLLLPTDHMSLIASTPRSDNSDTTILQYLLEKNPWLAAIEDWWQCDEADDGDPMGVLYPAMPNGAGHPRAMGAIVPVDFESLAPQEVGQNIVIPASGKCGGVAIRYPVGFRYIKGI